MVPRGFVQAADGDHSAPSTRYVPGSDSSPAGAVSAVATGPIPAEDEQLLLRAPSSVRVDVDPQPPADVAVAEQKKDRRREMQGLALNALSTVFGTGMSLFAKVSGSQGIGVFEIVLTRSLILVLFTGPELLWFKANPFHDKRRRWLLVLRGVLGFCSVSSLYMAVALLPLADASVLSFLSPIFVAALSPFILREKSSTGTLLGIPVAMVGVVLVAKPSFVFGSGGGISGIGVLVGIMQAFFNAMARMAVRALSLNSSERMSSIIFGQGAISCVGAAIMCAATKQFKIPTEASVWAPLLLGGFLGYLYQLALTAGLQRARAAPAVAMSYLSVIWGIVADVLVFHDAPEALSLVGAAIICCSSFLVAFTQKKKASHAAADKQWAKSSLRLQREQLLGEEQGEEEDAMRRPLLPEGPGSRASSPMAGRVSSSHAAVRLPGDWSKLEWEDGEIEVNMGPAADGTAGTAGSARSSPVSSRPQSPEQQLVILPPTPRPPSSLMHSVHSSANSLQGQGQGQG